MTDRELMQQALDALVEVEQTLKQISAFKIYPKYYEAIEALRARLAQPEQKHSEQWWRHEVSNAWAEGYEKGRASVKQPEQEIEPDRLHVEDDGFPTEKAVLQRFWREHQAQPEQEQCHHKFEVDQEAPSHSCCQMCGEVRKQPEQEPVATLFGSLPVYDVSPKRRKPPTQDLSAPLTVNGVPMYPQREWQTLTDEEMFGLWVKCPAETEDRFAFARAIEQALKEKNNG